MKLRDIHPNIKLRLAMQFLGSLISMAVIPFLAIYFSQKIGATDMGGLLLILGLTGTSLYYIITKTLDSKVSENNEGKVPVSY